jgi:hypothetical protein
MHCIHSQSPDLVAAVVPALVEEGYNFARIDQVQEYKPYETPETPAAVADSSGATPVRSAALVPSAAVK